MQGLGVVLFKASKMLSQKKRTAVWPSVARTRATFCAVGTITLFFFSLLIKDKPFENEG